MDYQQHNKTTGVSLGWVANRFAVGLGMGSLLFSLSGCGTLLPQARPNDILFSGPAKSLSEASQPNTASDSSLRFSDARQAASNPGQVDAIRTVAYNEPVASPAPVAPAAEPFPQENCEYCSPSYATGYPLPQCSCQPQLPQQPRKIDLQEYIFDGGDQQPQVIIRKDWTSAGVDPMDTVVYYETETGKVCVQPTNRVPIYAPRFGAVRQITGALLAEKTIGARRVHTPISPGRIEEANLAGAFTQPVAAKGQEQVHLLDAFQENLAGNLIDGIVPPQRMSDAFVPHEGIEVAGLGRITDDEIAVLGEYIQNARTWFVPEALNVVVDGQAAARVSTNKQPQDVHVYEIRDKCALRICKSASHTIANVGDTIRFTIRFDNAGTKSVGNVVLLDNLSARLDYIEGSQHGSVETQFETEPNSVGSQVLTWKLVKPLAAGEGGAISFDCRVR